MNNKETVAKVKAWLEEMGLKLAQYKTDPNTWGNVLHTNKARHSAVICEIHSIQAINTSETSPKSVCT